MVFFVYVGSLPKNRSNFPKNFISLNQNYFILFHLLNIIYKLTMKHIKSYNLFEIFEGNSEDDYYSDIISDIKYIFQDLDDIDFGVNIMSDNIKTAGLSISMVYPKSGVDIIDFKLSDVIETIKTANSYMHSLGYKSSYVASGAPGIKLPDDINNWELGIEVMYLCIFYSKG